MKRSHFSRTSPDVNNLGVPYNESFDEGGLLDLWLIDGGENWLYDEGTGNPAPSMIFNWSPIRNRLFSKFIRSCDSSRSFNFSDCFI